MPHFDGGGLADMLVDALPYVFVPVGNEAVCIDDVVLVVQPIDSIGRHRFPLISAFTRADVCYIDTFLPFPNKLGLQASGRGGRALPALRTRRGVRPSALSRELIYGTVSTMMPAIPPASATAP